MSGDYPIERLSQTKTVPSSDRKYSEVLKIANKGEKITVWHGADNVETIKKSSGYSIAYYDDKIKCLFQDILEAIDCDKNKTTQLSLF